MEILDDILSDELRDLWISTGFLIATLLLCEIVRFILKSIFKGKEGFLSKKLLCELLASGELCACCFELGVIADNYGVPTYATYLFSLTIWWSFRWGDSSACPYTHVEDFLQGQTPFKHLILIIIIEVIGGWASYPFYVKKFWLMSYEPKHVEKLAGLCPADLAVPVLHGCFIEGIATCMCQLTGRVMSRLDSKYANPINSLVGTTLVVAAFNMSGGYYNPVLATALQFNCGEVTRKDHFLVYWIGPMGGSVMSVLIWHSSTLARKLLGDPNKYKIE